MTAPQPNLSDIDLLADSTDQGNQVPDSPALSKVSELVAKYDVLGGDIKRLEALLGEKKQARSEIERELLPTAMTEAGVTSFVTKSGRSVKIDEVINGNIPAISTIEKAKGPEKEALLQRRTTAIAVVHEKWPGLIKTEVTVALGKGETDLASQMVELLRTQFDVEPSVDETIHPATLNSHFKELKDNGRLEEIPVEPFQLYIGPIAKIK
jgi:hypothetical protein